MRSVGVTAGDDVVPSGEDGCPLTAAAALVAMAGAATVIGDLMLCLVEAAPSGGFPRHAHTREDEFIYVMDGEFGWLVGDERHSGGRGAVAFIPRGTVHQVGCTAGEPGRALVCFARRDVDVLVGDAGHRPVDNAPEAPRGASRLARTNALAHRYGLQIVAWSA